MSLGREFAKTGLMVMVGLLAIVVFGSDGNEWSKTKHWEATVVGEQFDITNPYGTMHCTVTGAEWDGKGEATVYAVGNVQVPDRLNVLGTVLDEGRLTYNYIDVHNIVWACQYVLPTSVGSDVLRGPGTVRRVKLLVTRVQLDDETVDLLAEDAASE